MQGLLIALLLFSGCGPPAEIVGPFTGTTHRFVVDRLDLPFRWSDFAGDLDGNGDGDNQLGTILGALREFTSIGEGPEDAVLAQVAAGTIAPEVEIVTDDELVANDDTVGVRWIDGPMRGSPVLGAHLEEGVIATNLARYYDHPAGATVTLPIAGAADAVTIDLVGVDIILARDGRGGFTGAVHGALRNDDPAPFHLRCLRVIQQILDAWPEDHAQAYSILDTDGDRNISVDEFETDEIIQNVFAPDVQLFDAAGHWHPNPSVPRKTDSLSVGFGFHIKPCPSGPCLAPAAPSCLDRQRNGDETDRDCGGATCHPCAATLACKTNPDCQSSRCSNGRCEK